MSVRFDEHTAEVCAAWWAENLGVTDKREVFKEALKKRLIELDQERSFLTVGVDYDPDQVLLAALHDVGIECRGFLCSAEGLLPMKTMTKLDRNGDLLVSEGRGAPFVKIGEAK